MCVLFHSFVHSLSRALSPHLSFARALSCPLSVRSPPDSLSFYASFSRNLSLACTLPPGNYVFDLVTVTLGAAVSSPHSPSVSPNLHILTCP